MHSTLRARARACESGLLLKELGLSLLNIQSLTSLRRGMAELIDARCETREIRIWTTGAIRTTHWSFGRILVHVFACF